jgi:hypothetical protein
MSPLFADSHQALLALLHPDRVTTKGEIVEPVSTLGERQQRFDSVAQAPRWDEAPAPGSVLRAQMEAVDQALLQGLTQAGYLPALPRVKVRSAQHTSRTYGNASKRVIQRITLSVDDAGRVRPLVPENRDLAAVHAHVAEETWAARPSQDSWAHWVTLLHEAAHSAFNLMPHPFVTERLPAETVADLNAFLLGPLASPKGFWHRFLSESFADVYATMLLHQLAPDDPGMQQEVANAHHVRRLIRTEVFDPAVIQGQLLFTWATQTDLAVERALADRAHWQALPPTALQREACRHASEGLLAFLAPGRSLGGDQVLQDNLVRYLRREFNEFLTDHHLDDLAGRVAFEADAPTRSRMRAWRAAYPDHTALRLLDRILAKLNPDRLPFADVYPTARPEDRLGLVAQFVDKGIRAHGGTFRVELADRSQAVADQLLQGAPLWLPAPTPALPAAPARRRRRMP